jgi:hypothetical protein
LDFHTSKQRIPLILLFAVKVSSLEFSGFSRKEPEFCFPLAELSVNAIVLVYFFRSKQRIPLIVLQRLTITVFLFGLAKKKDVKKENHSMLVDFLL